MGGNIGTRSQGDIKIKKIKIKSKSKKKSNSKQNMKGKKANINYGAKHGILLGTDKEDNWQYNRIHPK